jgi:cytochrome c oxidase subunit IV
MENIQALEGQPSFKEERQKDPVVRSLMRVFWILLIVTIGEIALAFLHYFTHFPPRALLNAIFIGLTVVKAFYIIGEFMHMRHELKTLIWTILLPLIFLMWAVVAFLYEGNSTKDMRHRESSVIEASTPWEKVTHDTH